MNNKRIVAFMFCLLVLSMTFAGRLLAVADTSAQIHMLDNVRLDDADASYTKITISDCSTGKCRASPQIVSVSDSGLRSELKSFKNGDHLKVGVNDKGELQSVIVCSVEVATPARAAALAVSFLVVVLFAVLAAKGHPLQFIIGEDNRYSNSKFQIALWFSVLISTYIATIFLRTSHTRWDFVGGINIPQNLLVLTGLSAITFAGAKGITTAKDDAAKLTDGAIRKTSVEPGKENFWKDLFQNDVGVFDLGDFQMIVVTVLAVGTYLVLAFHFLGSIEFRQTIVLPDVDTTILAAFGLGQGAYLAKKAAGNLGTS